MFLNSPVRPIEKGVPDTFHPLGLSKEAFLSLFYDVDSFSVSISSLPLFTDALQTFLNAGGGSGGVIGAIQGLDAVDKSLAASPATVTGATRRIYIEPQYKFSNDDRGQRRNSVKLDVGGPQHSLSSSGGTFQIDCSDTVYHAGLFFPAVNVSIGAASSSAIGSIIGNVNLGNFGNIVIYSAYPLVALGNATVKNKYSKFVVSKQNELFTLKSLEASYSGFDSLTSISLDGITCSILSKTTKTVSFTSARKANKYSHADLTFIQEGKMNRVRLPFPLLSSF